MSAVAVSELVERANRKSFTYNDPTHVYMFDGQRCRSVTALAKGVSDNYNLNAWQKAMEARGFVIDPRLIEEVAAYFDDRARIDDIVQRAIDTAGANDKSRRGSQMHQAIKRDYDGDALYTEQQQLDAERARRTFEAYKLVPDPRYAERAVLYPDDLVAGRIDVFASWSHSPEWLVDIDTKSGFKAIKYPWATAAQLGLHVLAPLIQGLTHFEGGIEHTDRWDPMPENLRRDVAYVLHLAPDSDDIGTIYEFNLTGQFAGQMAAKAAIWQRHFWINNDMTRRVDPPLALADNVIPLFDPVAAQATLRARIDLLGEAERSLLRMAWQPEWGNIRMPMDPASIAAATEAVLTVDSFSQVTPLPERPEPSVTALDGPVPRWTPVEGGLMPTEAAGALQTAWESMDDPIKAVVMTAVSSAIQHGCSWHPGVDFATLGTTTERKHWLVLAAMELAVHDSLADDSARYLAATVLDADWPFDPRLTPGRVIGLVGVEHAEQFCDLTLAFIAGDLMVDGNRLIPNNERGSDADSTRT